MRQGVSFGPFSSGHSFPYHLTFRPTLTKNKILGSVLYLVSGRMRLAINDHCFALPFILLNLAELACLAVKGYKWRERSQNPMKLY